MKKINIENIEILKQLNKVCDEIINLENKLTETYYKDLTPNGKYEKVYKIINSHLIIISTVNNIVNYDN